MGRSSPLKIGVQTVGETVVVSPSGTLELTTAPQLRAFLAKRLADQPGAVIVMLQDLSLARTYSLSVFTNLARQIADWSGVPLLLVTGRNRSRELQRHSELISRFIPVFPDLATALAAIHNPPARQLSRLRLGAEPHSAATARRFVASVCELWHCEEVAEDAVAVVSELVANVIRHAHTEADLRLELRRQRLTIAVADGSPVLPVRRPPGVREDGLGLAIVTTLSSSWGATPTSSGGKVVCATIRLRSPNARVAINNSWRNGL